MRRLVPLGLAALALAAAPSAAELCTIDAVPAATLLLPYFEVDLDNPQGVNTLFSINNASAAPAIAKVSFWTDWSLLSINFDVFLTGYDVQTINLRNLFVDGRLPAATLVPGSSGCEPFPGEPRVTGSVLERLRKGHTGLFIPGGSCLGSFYLPANQIARGYVTIDNVSTCSVVFPNETGYFVDGGNGIANNINQLWGDWFIVEQDLAVGDTLVSIEAESGAFSAGEYTFYGRYVGGLAWDDREPLASTWATRYLTGGVAEFGTDLLVWRDSKCQTAASVDRYDCNAGPPWHPLEETQVVAFDEQEDAVELCGITFNPPNPPVSRQCAPLETQRLKVGTGHLKPAGDRGWLYLNLNHTLGDTSMSSPTPCSTTGLFGDIAQSWVTTLVASRSQVATGYAANQLTSACTPPFPIQNLETEPAEPAGRSRTTGRSRRF